MSEDLFTVTKDLKKKSDERDYQEKITEQNNAWSNFNGFRWGIFAGLGMALYLVILQLTSNNTIALQYFKYLIMGAFVAYGLSALKSYLNTNFRYSDGMKLGGLMTFASAATLSIMNMILFMWTENLAFDKFSMVSNSIENALLISGVLFFEVLVFGLILTFIWLQYIKRNRDDVRGI